jgi:ribosomal protein L29
MAIIKKEELKKMNEKEIEERIEQLRIELVKSKVANKTSKTDPSEIRRTIARLLTLKKSNKTGGKQ